MTPGCGMNCFCDACQAAAAQQTWWVWIDNAELAEVRLVDTGRALVPQRVDNGRFVSAKRCQLELDAGEIELVERDQLIVEDMYLLALAGC